MKTTRLVTREECGWLERDIQAGTEVYRCKLPHYGIIDDRTGFAATFNPKGEYPMFEFPRDAVNGDELDPINRFY